MPGVMVYTSSREEKVKGSNIVMRMNKFCTLN
jgi:hypothetical protein